MAVDNEFIYIFGGYSLINYEIIYNSLIFRINTSDFSCELYETIRISYTANYIPKQNSGGAYFNNTFYISQGNDWSTINTTWQKISQNSKSENLEMNISVVEYAYTFSKSRLFLFGGCSDNVPVNSLYEIDLFSLEVQELQVNYLFPPSRTYSSLTAIGENLYLFGGDNQGTKLGDFWVFEVNSEVWSTINVFGKIPSARSGHGSASDGFLMFIFGGEDPNYLNDLYEFNSLTNYSILLTANSQIEPTPRTRTCLLYFNSSLYFYGGIDHSGPLNEFWQYNLQNGEYTQLASGIYAYPENKCSVDSVKKLIYVSSSLNSNQIKKITVYDLVQQFWTEVYGSHINGLGSVDFFVGESLLSIGGLLWDTTAKKALTVFEFSSNITESVLVPVSFCNAAVSHFGDFLYIYGGSLISASLILSEYPSSLFVKVRLSSISHSSYCSAGSYFVNNGCVVCDRGTYSDVANSTFCVECPTGTFNKVYGANSLTQCLPCNTGFWNNSTGQRQCRDCPVNQYCPYGSTFPSVYLTDTSFQTIQPSPFIQTANTYNYYSNLTISVVMAFFTIGLFLILFKRFRNKLEILDIYTSLHNHKLLVPMYIKTTNFGGLFTLVFITIATIFVIVSILKYEYLNIIETRTLVPLVTVTDTIRADLEFDINYIYYGGACGENNACLNSTGFSFLQLNGTTVYNCTKIGPTCNIHIMCNSCSVTSGAEISISLSESYSFCSQIQVSVTSTTSIPHEISKITASISSDLNSYFKGPIPTIFTYTLIPTIFSQKPNDLTGYHVSMEENPVQGSQYGNQFSAYGSGLNLQINLSILSTVLSITRGQETGILELFSALIGTVFGILSSIGGIMRFTEKYYEALLSWYEHKSKMVFFLKRKRKLLGIVKSETEIENTDHKPGASLPVSDNLLNDINWIHAKSTHKYR